MAKMKISGGSRYQKTCSPSQKKARELAAIMALVMRDALSSAAQKRLRATVLKDRLHEET